MTILTICNAITFICACVLFCNFRTVNKRYEELKKKYDEETEKCNKLNNENYSAFCEKDRLKDKIRDLERANESLREDINVFGRKCKTVSDLKRRIRVAAECFEHNNNCEVKDIHLYLGGRYDDIKIIDVKL